MSYSYNSTTQMPNTSMNTAMNTLNSMSSAGTMMIGTLGTNGTVNSFLTGGTNSIFDTQLKAQETNQALTAQAMKNTHDNNYQGSVLAASAMAQTAVPLKYANDIVEISGNNTLINFFSLWDKYEDAVASNSVYGQTINTSKPEERRALAMRVFKELTGYSIQEVLKKAADSSATNGLKTGASFGLAGSSTSADDCIAYLNGTETKLSTKATEVASGSAGGALVLSSASIGTIGLGKVIDVAFETNITKNIKGKDLGRVGLVAAAVGAVASAVITGFKINDDSSQTSS